MLKVDIITIFPEMFKGPFDESMVRRAVDMGLAEIRVIDLRDFSDNKHFQVDDTPYGGGKGMVLKPEPLFKAVESVAKEASGREKIRVILMSPQGEVFHQQKARKLSKEEHLVILCGHYEGVDERVRNSLIDEEISIGDYVLTGGEIAAMVVTDAVVRLQPGLLSEEAVNEESFEEGVLEYPQYTRPYEYRGMRVPEVLLSGNHALIREWRKEKSLENTRRKRPDLYRRYMQQDQAQERHEDT